MTLAEYQKQIDDMLQDYEKPYWHPLEDGTNLLMFQPDKDTK